MADYGAAVSQKGYDVKTCADRFLVYSSAFQSLKVFMASAVTTTIPASGTNTITVTHNLGYYAPYFVVYNGSTSIGINTSYFMRESDETSSLDTKQYTDRLEIDVDGSFDSPSSSTGDTVYFTVYIFLDDFTTVSQQNINSGTTSGASSTDYGFRISKPGVDVKTCDDIDCILSSSFFTHIVHRKGIDTSGDVTVSVSHNLGYLPMAFAYANYSGSYIQYASGLQLTTTNIQLVTGGDTDVYYLIFKQKNG